MAQVASSVLAEPENRMEIVIHVDESLGADDRNELVASLVAVEGIHSAEFCPLRWHLMLVQYDRDRFNSRDVLVKVHACNVHAELIGPV